MTGENFNPVVYSKNVIEFVTVANEYCSFLENSGAQTTRGFLEKIQKILPLLYLKTAVLPQTESFEEMGLEKYVSEVDYNFLQQKVMNLLGEHDDFQEVFDPGMQFSDAPLTSSISECLADVYQDLKDFLMSYRIGDETIMLEALWVCTDNFKNYWGQKLVNCLRAVHAVIYSDADLENSVDLTRANEDEDETGDKPEWLNRLFKNKGDY